MGRSFSVGGHLVSDYVNPRRLDPATASGAAPSSFSSIKSRANWPRTTMSTRNRCMIGNHILDGVPSSLVSKRTMAN